MDAFNGVRADEQHNGRRGPDDEVSLLRFVNMLLRHRFLLISTTVLAGAAVLAWGLTRPRTYTARALFVPQAAEAARSGVAGIAAQFGVSLPAGAPGQSPLFYVDLIQSEALLGALVDAPYTAAAATSDISSTLSDLLEIPQLPTALRRDATIRAARGVIKARPVRETGMVHVDVRTRDPELSRQIADRTLRLVDEINVRSRQNQAAAERQFIQQRLDSTRNELLGAERKLELFLEHNRQFQSSPQLRFTHDRLDREVMMRQQVFTSISQAYEQARIDEVRNVPMIRVMQQPTLPVLPDSRGMVGLAAFGLAFGFLLGLAGAIARDVTHRSSTEDEGAYAEFEALRRAVRADFARPLIPIRSILRIRSTHR